MDYGFFRIAAATPNVTVADCEENSKTIIESIRLASNNGAKLIVTPELCITGYTCSDLFLQDTLLKSAADELEIIAEKTKEINSIIAIGLPFRKGHTLYNVAAVLFKGKIICMIPKSYIPNYSEFYEKRHFTAWNHENKNERVFFSQKNPDVLFGTKILISDCQNPNVKVAFEICEDLWVPLSPSVNAALKGATVIANLSASNEIIGKSSYRQTLVSAHSAKLCCAYIYANAGNGESTTDLVFSGHSIIAENGTILAQKSPFSDGLLLADADIERIIHERSRTTTFSDSSIDFADRQDWDEIKVSFSESKENQEKNLLRKISSSPFVPSDESERKERCQEVIELQSHGLAKRLRHTHAKTAVIGLSGGLDSTLALLVTCRAFDICALDKKNIISVTMPCFGTTDRTYSNACTLARETLTTLKEINISQSVRQHFKDISHDENVHDTTYENCQARERTQVLMDLANKTGGLVIGTGDLSEQALGWATYNGDHMSMYGVNASIPKTLVRYLVKWFADEAKSSGKEKEASCLYDILDTPVSPELLPPDGKNIAQKTEELVGPYELHDFFLYYVLRFGFSPEKIFFLAKNAFGNKYDGKTIKKWLLSFYRRFFSQQFKRSCMPDGAKVGTINLSPRGDWRMPSDASASLWIKECEKIGE